MIQNQEAIGAVITAENGKPYGEGKGEVGYSASFCDWASHECRRVHGETMSSPWADRKGFSFVNRLSDARSTSVTNVGDKKCHQYTRVTNIRRQKFMS